MLLQICVGAAERGDQGNLDFSKESNWSPPLCVSWLSRDYGGAMVQLGFFEALVESVDGLTSNLDRFHLMEEVSDVVWWLLGQGFECLTWKKSKCSEMVA